MSEPKHQTIVPDERVVGYRLLEISHGGGEQGQRYPTPTSIFYERYAESLEIAKDHATYRKFLTTGGWSTPLWEKVDKPKSSIVAVSRRNSYEIHIGVFLPGLFTVPSVPPHLISSYPPPPDILWIDREKTYDYGDMIERCPRCEKSGFRWLWHYDVSDDGFDHYVNKGQIDCPECGIYTVYRDGTYKAGKHYK